jgi:organic hydroperoxide reductase OsmC/OhrA
VRTIHVLCPRCGWATVDVPDDWTARDGGTLHTTTPEHLFAVAHAAAFDDAEAAALDAR